jgi:NAD(P)-dependent dehydrogenase (short-subunit alcohol dehydrogenase family)
MTQPLAIVAGVGPGIGAAVARRFAREGFRIAIVARSVSRLELVAAPMREAGATVAIYHADLSDHEATRQVIETITAEHGRASALIWNAAAWVEIPGPKLQPDEFDRQFRLGLSSALSAIQTAGPAMSAGGGGSIILTGGGLSLSPQYGQAVPALTAVKSALRGFVHASASEFAQTGLRLSTVTVAGQVAPGGAFDPDRIATAFWKLHTSPNPDVELIFDGRAEH